MAKNDVLIEEMDISNTLKEVYQVAEQYAEDVDSIKLYKAVTEPDAAWHYLKIAKNSTWIAEKVVSVDGARTNKKTMSDAVSRYNKLVLAIANDTNAEYRDLLSAELEVLNAYAVKCICDMHMDDNDVLSALELEEEERQAQKSAKSNR